MCAEGEDKGGEMSKRGKSGSRKRQAGIKSSTSSRNSLQVYIRERFRSELLSGPIKIYTKEEIEEYQKGKEK